MVTLTLIIHFTIHKHCTGFGKIDMNRLYIQLKFLCHNRSKFQLLCLQHDPTVRLFRSKILIFKLENDIDVLFQECDCG